MRLSCGYAELMKVISDVAVISDTSLSNPDLRNVIFHLKRGVTDYVELIGINLYVIIKKKLNESGVSVVFTENELASESEDMYFQINCKELLGFFGSYKNIRKTQVKEVSFDVSQNVVKCTVVEVDKRKDDVDERLIQLEGGGNSSERTYVSQWDFTNIVMKRAVLDKIEKVQTSKADINDECKTLTCSSILWVTSMVLPVMQSVTSLYGYAIFDKDYVVAFSSAANVFTKNIMYCDGVFEGLKLNYVAMSFLNKLCNNCDSTDTVDLWRDNQIVYVFMEDCEVYLFYETNLPQYQDYINMFKKDHVITLDRIYLKDVLKRFSLVDDNIEVKLKLDDDIVVMSNSRLSQDLYINYKKDMDSFSKFRFKILPDVLSKAILGVDELMLNMVEGGANTDIYLYCCSNGEKSVNLIFTDGTGLWFSIVTVRFIK